MNDLLFYFLFYSIMGSTGIMLIIAFVFSSKKVRVKKDTSESSKFPSSPKIHYPSNFKKYRIDVIIDGRKGKVIRYGPDYISTNKELIREFRSQGVKIETGMFKELDRK